MKKDWVVNTPEQLGQVLKLLGRAKVDRTLRITVEHYIATRSYEQNAKYWACVGEAAKHIGCSAEDLHEDLLCAHFGAEEHRMPTGHIRRTPNKRSSALDKKEFSEYLDFVITYLNSELGMQLV